MDSRAVRYVQPTLLIVILLRHITIAVPSVLQYQQPNEQTDSYAFGAIPADPLWQNGEPAVETWPNTDWLPPASWPAPAVPYQWPQPLPWYPAAPAPAPPAATTTTVPATTTTTTTTTTTPPPTTTTSPPPPPTTVQTTTAAASAQPPPAHYPHHPPPGHYYPVQNWQYVPIVAPPQVPYPWDETYHYPVYYPAPVAPPPSTGAATAPTAATTPIPTTAPTTTPTPTTTTTTVSPTTTAAPTQGPTTRYVIPHQPYYHHHHLPAAPPQYVAFVAPKPQKPYGTSWSHLQSGSWRNGNNNDAVEQITSNDKETQQENLDNGRQSVDKRPCNPGNIPHGTLRRPTNSTGSANSRNGQGPKLVSERFLEACVDGRWTVVACSQTVSASANAGNEKIRRLECSVDETGGQASSRQPSTEAPSRDANLEQSSGSNHPTSLELQWQSFQSVKTTPQKDVQPINTSRASSPAPEQHQPRSQVPVPASAVVLNKCRPGLTEADVTDSKAYHECILVGTSSETGWVARRCAEGTVYSSTSRGCSRPAPTSS